MNPDQGGGSNFRNFCLCWQKCWYYVGIMFCVVSTCCFCFILFYIKKIDAIYSLLHFLNFQHVMHHFKRSLAVMHCFQALYIVFNTCYFFCLVFLTELNCSSTTYNSIKICNGILIVMCIVTYCILFNLNCNSSIRKCI